MPEQGKENLAPHIQRHAWTQRLPGGRKEIRIYKKKPNRIQQYGEHTTTIKMFQQRTEPKN